MKSKKHSGILAEGTKFRRKQVLGVGNRGWGCSRRLRLEPLEQRMLLAVISAGDGNNSIGITLDASWENVSVLIDGGPAVSFPVTEAITIEGEGGNDTLTIDFGAGAPALASFLDLTFNGGDGSDRIVLQNGSMDTVTHQFASAAAGSVAMAAPGGSSGMLAYSGLEPITDNLNVANRVFTFTNSVSDGALTTSPVTPATQTRIDSSQSESVDFTTPSNSLVVNLAAGNNTFSVTSLANDYNTPTNTVNGNANDDFIHFEVTDGSAAVASASVWTVNGLAGNDTVALSPLAMNLDNLRDGIIFNGGSGGTDTLNIHDDNHGGGDTFAVTSTTVDRSSWGDDADPGVTYDAAVEVVNLVAGGGADTINVVSTSATAATTIDGNSGDDLFQIDASALGGANLFFGNTGDDTFNVNITAGPTIAALLTIRGDANDFGAGVGSRDQVLISDQVGSVFSPIFTYTSGGPDGSQLTVGGLGSVVTVETVETVAYQGSAADNDVATVVGTAGSDLITVAPITGNRALVFNNNATDANGPFDGPPQEFAARIPGVSGGGTRPDLDLSGLANVSGLTITDSGGANRLYVYGESETGLNDGNTFDPFGFGPGMVLPAVAIPNAYDTISVSDTRTTVDSLVAVNYNATDFAQALPLVDPAIVVNAGREMTNPAGTADDIAMTLSANYKFQINGNDPDPATTGIVPPSGDRLTVTGVLPVVNVWSTKVAGGSPIVSMEFPASGLLPFAYSSIEDFGIINATTVNLIGDNNDPGVDQSDHFVVVGRDVDGDPTDGGVGEFELVINGSLPVRFNDVQFLNVFGDDQNPAPGTPSGAPDIDTLEITPYADDMPRGWGIDVSFDEGNPAQADGAADLIIYHTSLFGGAVSEDIVIQPSGPEAGEIVVTNRGFGTPIVDIDFTTNLDIIVLDDDGFDSDTDTLTLRGTNPDSPAASGHDLVNVDFGAAGTVADPMVTVEDMANSLLLYRLRTINDGAGDPTFSTVRIETLGGDDWISVDPDAEVAVVVDAGGPIGKLQQPVGDVLNVLAGGTAFTFVPGPEGDEGSVVVGDNPAVSFDHVELLKIDDENYVLADEFDQPDAVLPPNDSIDTAAVLGSLPKITLRDLTLHDTGDEINEDFFQITAQDTGKLVINVFFEHDQGNIDIQIVDAEGNLIDVSNSNDNDEQLVIPVVSQEQYFLHVYSVGVGEGEAQPNVYNVEIENFAAPVPDAVVFDPTDDTGQSASDHVTFEEEARIIIQADLAEFAAEGITILTAAEAAAGVTPGAAVQVFVNGVPVGYADALGASNTLFQYTFSAGDLSTAFIPAGGGGGLNLVKAAVQIFDGQGDAEEQPDPATGRTQLSEPLLVTLDMTAPDPSTPDLIETSDTGADNFDDITAINQPAFAGIAEANAKVRVYANDLLVGEGIVGSDATDGVLGDGLGLWEVTVEPLKNGQFAITTTIEDLAGNISDLSDPLVIVVDPMEPNDTLAEAVILGSLPKITINDVFLYDVDDVDFFKYTAQDTGKLIVNAFSNGDVGLRVRDVNGHIIAEATPGTVLEGLNIDGLVIPVVTQQEYFIEVYFDGEPPEEEGVVQHVAVYDLEIENFAAPLVDNVDLPEKDQFDVLNDTGLSQFDNVTSRTMPEIILEADLHEFFEEGIVILTAAEAEAGLTAGAAVEVFVNGISVGFADLIAGTGETLFRYTFEAGELPEATFVGDSGGWLHYVKGAVRIFDAQMAGGEEPGPDPNTGRTQLSEPLQLIVDTTMPVASVPDMLDSSDSGRYNNDNVTKITTPAFSGTAEHNATVRIFAIDITDPGNPGMPELVGQGRVGTDLTEDEFNQIGSWEITIEPLDDHSNDPSPLAHYASYEIITEIEDLAGNITRLEGEDALQIWIDATVPNTPYLDVLGLEGTNLLAEVSDTGRHDADNVTFDATPTVSVTVNDTPLGNGNPFPNTLIYRIYDRPDPSQFGDAPNNGEVLLVDSFVTQGGFNVAGFFLETLPLLADGVHNLKLEVEDLAGNLSEDFLLTVTIDTQIPPVSFGQPGDPGDGLMPDSDTGVSPPNPDTIVDRVTSNTWPGFWGRAEADTIVRAYADVNGDGVLQVGVDVFLGQTTAIPLDGNLAEPDGYWQLESIVNMNDPDFFPTPDGLRTIFLTAEDVAGNVNSPEGAAEVLEIFVDTTGPVITDVSVTGEDYDLFDPKPSTDGPTPLVYSISIDFMDLPERLGPDFLYDALKQDVALHPGHYSVVGDANGVIPIQQVMVTQEIGLDNIARATVELVFYEPLPDDRFTLIVSDAITDPVGNALDGESNATEPQEDPLFPTGDGVSGGEFVARFTIDSRPEIGVWAAGSVWVDTNGNFSFDPDNLDFTNRDITYVLAFTSDNVFNGNFAAGAGDTADGFDKLAAYGRVGSQYRWLIDTDNDGVPNLDVSDPANINGLPIAGRFDNSDANGDEVGIRAGNVWYFDTNHDFRVDYSLVSELTGYPIVGDFDGDGFDDLATYADDRFEFDLANGTLRGWDGVIDGTIDFGFIGVRERPVAADMNQDGIDDIGLWTPDRAGATPEELSEWYFLISDREIEAGRGLAALDHPFTPIPFGEDIYARFGDEYAMPLVGNFDPPVVSGQSAAPIGAAQLTATVVETPTAVGVHGEIDALPESIASMNEWDAHWVEVWVSVADTLGGGVTLAMADLSYNTDCFTPTAIEYGPAFTENQFGTIDDAAGVIEGLGAATSLAGLGDSQFVLLARVRFEPTSDDPGLPVSPDGAVESHGCNVALSESRVALTGDLAVMAQMVDGPATELRPFVFDLDDDGRVGLGDLSYFAAAYRKAVGTPGIAYSHASDFDGDGVIGLGDLSYLAAAYGRTQGDLATVGEAMAPLAMSVASSAPDAPSVDAVMTEQAPPSDDVDFVWLAAYEEQATRQTSSTKQNDQLAKTLAVDLFFTEDR